MLTEKNQYLVVLLIKLIIDLDITFRIHLKHKMPAYIELFVLKQYMVLTLRHCCFLYSLCIIDTELFFLKTHCIEYFFFADNQKKPMTAHGFFNFYSGNINKRYARQYALSFLFFYNSIDVNALNMHYILKIRSTFTIPCRTISVRCRKNQM